MQKQGLLNGQGASTENMEGGLIEFDSDVSEDNRSRG